MITDKQTGERLPRVWPRRESGERMDLKEVGMLRAAEAPAKVWENEEENTDDSL